MRKLVFALTRLTAVAYHLGLSQARARFGATVTVMNNLKTRTGPVRHAKGRPLPLKKQLYRFGRLYLLAFRRAYGGDHGTSSTPHSSQSSPA